MAMMVVALLWRTVQATPIQALGRDLAALPEPRQLWAGSRQGGPKTNVSEADICAWLFTADMLAKFLVLVCVGQLKCRIWVVRAFLSWR